MPKARIRLEKPRFFASFDPLRKIQKIHLKMNKRKNGDTQPETVSFFRHNTIVHPPSPLKGIGSRDRHKIF
jgi:hypothetical protein